MNLKIRAMQFELLQDERGTIRSAVIGGLDNCYRYELRRVWDASRALLVVCMLNPSTADAERDDPTIRTLIHFATSWGYGGFLVVNLYAWRASSPAELRSVAAPFGLENARYLNAAIGTAAANGGSLLAAWGDSGPDDYGCDEWFANRALNASVTLLCLGRTRSGKPKHPMARGRCRIPRDQQPLVWREAL